LLRKSNKGSLNPLEDDPKFHCIIDDVSHEAVVEQLTQKVDVVFHLAAAVGVKLIVDEPVRTIETNIRGTEVVLKYACRYRKRVLITSTSEVYGQGLSKRFREEDDCLIGPSTQRRWCYAASKLLDEFLALGYWHETGLPVTVVRLFNTIGPRQSSHYGMVVPRFIEQAEANLPLTIYGSGEQTRSFTSVHDVVFLIYQLSKHPEAPGQVFNIGNEEEVSINQLAALILKMTGSDSETRHIPYRKAYGEVFEDMKKRVPNNQKVLKLTGYPSFRLLETSLQEILDWKRESLISDQEKLIDKI